MFGVLLRAFVVTSFVGLGVSYGPVYLSHIVLAGLLVSGGVLLVRGRGRMILPRLPTNLHLFLVAMVAWYMVTSLWSPSKIDSLRYLFYLAYGTCIALGVVYYAKNGPRLLGLVNILLVVLGIEAAIGLLESFTAFRYPISPQSPLVEHFGRQMLLQASDWDKRSMAVITSYPTGFRWNPNNLSVVLNMFLPFILMRRNVWFKVAGASIILILIVASSSKINLLAWILMVVVYALAFSKRRGIYTVAILLAFGATVIAEPLLSKSLGRVVPQSLSEVLNSWQAVKRFFSEERHVGDSVTMRRKYVENGLAAIAGSYGLGVGAGCSGEETYQQGAVEAGATRASLHNFWLEMAADAGLLFAGLFWCWFAFILRHLLRIRTLTENPGVRYLSSSCALAMAGLVVAAAGPSSVVYEPVFWLILGLSIAAVNLGYVDATANG